MPVVEVHLIEGYDDNAKSRLCASLTDAVRLVVPADCDAVTVIVHETGQSGYMRGRTLRSPAPALPDPAETVRAFLAAMEARDLEAAGKYLGPGFAMMFPGSPEMQGLPELIAWAKPRYRFVTKTYTGFDVMQSEGDPALVYARGTLAGQWPDGRDFADIRFIDRFELLRGKITRQEVWNDIAEIKAQETTAP